MKKSLSALLFAALVALTITTAPLFAQDDAETKRKAFVQGFEQLLKNTGESLNKSADTGEKFAIAPVTVNQTSYNLGIKVWFSLEDGTIFNPVKRKMAPKERFYVHIQSAVPVYVSLFQNYPESRPESKQVYPDAKHPDTLKVVQANVATKLPVPFEMDEDTRDEIMAMVVVRADAPQIQSTLVTTTTTTTTGSTTSTATPAVNATATVTRTDDGVATVTTQATASTAGVMKSINDGLAGKTMEDPTKFAIAAPTAAATTATATAPNDAAFYMLGAGHAGQWQLTLKK
jgi:hypothetical protein